jgi:hypothetical protein
VLQFEGFRATAKQTVSSIGCRLCERIHAKRRLIKGTAFWAASLKLLKLYSARAIHTPAPKARWDVASSRVPDVISPPAHVQESAQR